ncbi:MAG: hypothetical protein M1819_003778 [Sarea resinae]|nr:MAG: hypothetical protein M1819_003778 [Sarea resinae]
MDSPPKRRKTSPTTAVAIETTTRTPPPPSPRRPTSSHASYLSPTKASLSRFNPGLLPRPRSAGNDVQRPSSRDSANSVQSARISQGQEEVATDGSLMRSRPATPEVEEQAMVDSRAAAPPPATPSRLGRSPGQGLSALPRRSRTPGQPLSPSKVFQPSKELVREKVLAETAQENLLSPQERGILQQTRGEEEIRQGQLDNTEDEEPELPLTPTQRGLADPIITTPPRGLLNTPSKRPKRARVKGAKNGASPLKPKGPSQQETLIRLPDPATVDNGNNGTKLYRRTNRIRRRHDIVDTGQDPNNPILSKRQLKAHLLTSLSKLQEEVRRCEAAVARAQDPEALPEQEENLADLLSLLVPSKDSAETTAVPKKPPSFSLSDTLALFLPFSAWPEPHRTLPPTPQSSNQVASSSTNTETSLPPSHRPLHLPNPLPHLQLFTPLTLSSKTTLIPSATQALRHRQTLTLTSPSSLLTATLSFTTSTHLAQGSPQQGPKATSLTLVSLSPWAEHELGAYIRARALGDLVQGFDIPGVCYAVGEYWDLCVKRAKCWIRCREKFAHLLGEEDTVQPTAQAGIPPRARGRPKGNSAGARRMEDEDEGNSDDNDGEETGHASQQRRQRPLQRTLLAYNLPIRNLTFTSTSASSPNASLTITWAISLHAPTSIAESRIEAHASFPTSYHVADARRKTLSKIPAMFSQLVEQLGVFGAVEGVIAVLFDA